MEFDLLVRGGQLVLPEVGVIDADLAVNEGRVAAILPRESGATAGEIVDAAGLLVLPGVVDPHAHLELGPGDARYHETRSAALGGVTTVLTYVTLTSAAQKLPPFSQLLEAEIAKLEAESVVDVGIHLCVITSDQLSEIPLYVEKYGITSFKHFMHFKKDYGAYMGASETDDGHLYMLLRAIARYPQAVLALHTENIEIVWRLSAELSDGGRDDLAAHSEARPPFVEADNIATAILLTQATGARSYIVHMTSAQSLDVYRKLALDGPGHGKPALDGPGQTYAETCPHYLTHTMYDALGTLGKVNPPLRMKSDVDAMWEALADGTIDAVGSDHCPRRMELKQGSIWKSSAGFPGMATMLPVLLSEGVHKRGIPIEAIVRACAYRPAQIYGLYPKKGTLLPGADADIALVDLNLERVVRASELLSFADYSPYEGWNLKGWPVRTIVRGRTVMQDGDIVSPDGYGRYVRPQNLARWGGESQGQHTETS